MSHEEGRSDAPEPQPEMAFELDATEEELLDEFGLLMAAEYQYMQSGQMNVRGDRGKLTFDVQVKPRREADLSTLAKTRPDLHKLYERFRSGGGQQGAG